MDPFEDLERLDEEFVYALDEARARIGLPPYGSSVKKNPKQDEVICPVCLNGFIWQGVCSTCSWAPIQ